MPPLLLDLTHTCHSQARTGVQRVCRSLWRELGADALAVTHDPFEAAWRPLEPWERTNLTAGAPAGGRRARWPIHAQVRGRLRGLAHGKGTRLRIPEAAAATLLVPEIFTPETARALPALLAGVGGPRVALFHDALALQFPEHTPANTVARFPSYLQELLQFDGIAAVSAASKQALLDYWDWLGISRRPQVVALSLGVDPPATAVAAIASPPTALCVSSLEGRKNHLALLAACESLWSAGARFHLRLIGLSNSETAGPALGRIAELKRAGRPLQYDGPVDDATLESAYAECTFTVYPSLAEGFGLPVAESLLRGKPCLCRFAGALGEIARGGGCASLGQGTAPEIAAALDSLWKQPDLISTLSQAARARTFRTWKQYAAELVGWAKGLSLNA